MGIFTSAYRNRAHFDFQVYRKGPQLKKLTSNYKIQVLEIVSAGISELSNITDVDSKNNPSTEEDSGIL